MRAIPLRRPVPARLPTPVITKPVVQQPVSLRPMGNTVAVTTLADNPFEGRRVVTVRTQASGGMAKPDPSQQSRGLLHAYLPGLGDTAQPAAPAPKPAGALDFLTTAASTAADLYKIKEQQRIEAARTQQLQAQAAAAQSEAQRAAILAQMSRPWEAMGQRKSITIPLLVIGGSALAVAAILYLRKRGKK